LLVLPPIPEQRAIAAFLDRETARIDALIEKKRRQIELLREKRSALISHTVTKGLDPNAKMKDSGIEWLGEIPEGWEIRKLKYIASVQFSNVDKNTVEGEEPVRLCNYIDVYKNEFIKDDFEFMQATATRAEIGKFTLKQGDVIITKDSESWTDIAVPAYVTDQLQGVLCGYHLAQIRAKSQILDGKYLFRAFASKLINYQFQVASTGITRYGLGNYWLENGLLVLPPIPEQRAIAAFLDRETARIDALIEKVETSIKLLLEYRTALISEAVTGKIDVRKEVA
jgi:type I restriction enzyme S subunit